MDEKEIAERVKEQGGRIYLVGGAVRDKLRGKSAKDKDYCISGLNDKKFIVLFPKAKKIGKSFPVYELEINGTKCEVSLARQERKTGTGYHGFETDFNATVTIEDDLYRRDTTINAMAIELPEGKIIDPYGGRADIKAGIIRAVSEHFRDDPVRALRAARQSAEFGYEITNETLEEMHKCEVELLNEPSERIMQELRNALKTEKPSRFFRNLEKAGLLKGIFPELHKLKGKIQPQDFHPEGDAFEHTMNITDEVSKWNEKPEIRFAALVHDIGKGETPEEMLPHHYQHEVRGQEILDRWNKRMTLPREWLKIGKFIIKEHMRAPIHKRPGKIVDMLIRINSVMTIKDFNDIIRADHKGLPSYLANGEELLKELLKVKGSECPEGLKGEQIGEWIRAERIRYYVKIRDSSA